jgi:hypothetical protein
VDTGAGSSPARFTRPFLGQEGCGRCAMITAPPLKVPGPKKSFGGAWGARAALPDRLVAGGIPVAAPANAALTY